jgi:hypothetical protein
MSRRIDERLVDILEASAAISSNVDRDGLSDG